MVQGTTTVGLRAEHGFAAPVTVRRATSTTTVLFDTGLSPDVMVVNADRLGVDLTAIQAVARRGGALRRGLAGRVFDGRVERPPGADRPCGAFAMEPGIVLDELNRRLARTGCASGPSRPPTPTARSAG
jgi:hypothetical protein